jgi:N-acetyl-anhydromuramyl-L-alanine amidase AmpD
MAWFDRATKKEIKHNVKLKKMVHPIRGLVLHITDTHQTLESLFGDFNNPHQTGRPRSAHFGIAKDGELWQFVDIDNVAFAVDGMWGGNGVDNHWVSVENVAKNGELLTMDQIMSLAVLMDWLHRTEGVPYKTAEKLDDSGLGYHRMFGKGDHVCPGSKVVAQRENILRLTDCGI